MQSHLAGARRRRVAVDGHAGAVGTAVAELQQHVAEMATERCRSAPVDFEKRPAIPHMDSAECRQGTRAAAWALRTIRPARMCAPHCARSHPGTKHVRLHIGRCSAADTLPPMSQPFTAPSSREDVERHIRENDVEFLFAQFVDMHGKPNAKLVPARHLDGLLDDGAGFAGFAAGAIGQQPNDPDIAAMPDVRSLHPASLEAGRGPHGLRRDRRGRGVALLPAHHPAPPARARALTRLRVHDRRRARVLPRARAPRTARSSWPTRSTPSTSPVTTCARSRATSTSSRRSRAT